MVRRRLGFCGGRLRAGSDPGPPEELRREDEATCTGYGFHPGTDAFASCLQRESLAGVTGLLRHPRIGVGIGADRGGIGLRGGPGPGGLSNLNVHGVDPEHRRECHPQISPVSHQRP